MSLGDGGQQRKTNEDSYNSRLTLFDPPANKYLKFRFWAGKLSVSINVLENNPQGAGLKYSETIAAYLTPIKAKMLAEELRKFMEDKKSNPVGVVTGGGETNTCLTFLYKDDNVVVDISKVDQNGKKTESDSFTMQKDYHYTVSYKNFDKLDFAKTFYNDIELRAVIDLLDNFFVASNGANAYSVLDMSRFSYNRLRSNTEAIMDKLGIQRQSSRGYGGGSANSFFSNANNNNSPQGYSEHVDDIDDLI